MPVGNVFGVIGVTFLLALLLPPFGMMSAAEFDGQTNYVPVDTPASEGKADSKADSNGGSSNNKKKKKSIKEQ